MMIKMMSRFSLHPFVRYTTLASLAVALSLSTGTSLAAKIYKTVDKDGNVVFTDVPPKDKSTAIEVETGNNYTPPATDRPVAAPRETPAQDDDEAEAIAYTGIAIVSPDNDAAVRENSGNLTVALQIQPNFNPASGHVVQLIMDGNVVKTAPATSFTLANIDRGTHILTAQLIDPQGQVLAATPPTTFHMQRRSVLLPPKKPVKPRNPS